MHAFTIRYRLAAWLATLATRIAPMQGAFHWDDTAGADLRPARRDFVDADLRGAS